MLIILRRLYSSESNQQSLFDQGDKGFVFIFTSVTRDVKAKGGYRLVIIRFSNVGLLEIIETPITLINSSSNKNSCRKNIDQLGTEKTVLTGTPMAIGEIARDATASSRTITNNSAVRYSLFC